MKWQSRSERRSQLLLRRPSVLVAALAWNGAIRAIFAKVFGDPDTILAMLIYAVVVTIIAIIATIIVARSVAKQG